MAADENMIGFITSNTAAVMAPTGSAERVYGKDVGMVYDTSKVAGVGCSMIVINIEEFMSLDYSIKG